ncbi:hypothetical protein ACFX2A_003164 [Malus domestica]
MGVDTNPFPTATVNMVDARLPRDKGKRKVEFVTMQRILKQNFQPQFNIDFCSNKPPTALLGSAIVKPMTNSSTNEKDGLAVLCRQCKANVNTEPKEKLSQVLIQQPMAATHQKMLDAGQHQRVFDRLGPKAQFEEKPSVRRRLDFNAPFYNEDYYAPNSSSLGSSPS